MHKELSHLVEEGILTPIRDLTLQTDEKEDYNKCFVFKHNTLDMTNQGFTTTKDQDNTPTSKTAQRAQFSKYVMFPTKFKIPR